MTMKICLYNGIVFLDTQILNALYKSLIKDLAFRIMSINVMIIFIETLLIYFSVLCELMFEFVSVCLLICVVCVLMFVEWMSTNRTFCLQNFIK